MNSAFYKFKRRICRQHLLFSAMLGLAPGLFAFGVMLLFDKLDVVSVPIYLLIGFPVLLTVASFLVSFFVFRPKDRSIAVRLDDELSLGERVQTMLRFDTASEEMVVLQREDTEQRLSAIPVSTIKPARRILRAALSLVLAVSLVIVSLVFPVTAETDAPTEPEIAESEKEMYIVAVRRLIEIVSASFMDETLKAQDLTELESLLSTIEGSDHFSVMKAAAIRVTINVGKNVLAVNTAPLISDELRKSDLELLKSLADSLAELSASAVRKQLRAIRTEVKKGDADEVFKLANGLDAALRNSEAAREDSVCNAFFVFSASLTTMASTGDFSGIEDAVDLLDSAISEPILTQKDNRLTTDRVISELIKLFGITDDDLKEESGEDNPLGDADGGGYEPPEEETETDKIFDGAIGDESGDFPSDDLIYSPDDDAYVTYSELIDRYLAIAEDRILDGIIDEMTAEGIIEYFRALFGSD